MNLFKVSFCFITSNKYQHDHTIYTIIRGTVSKLYFTDIITSPLNKLVNERVNPQPGHGILNTLRNKHALNPK